MADENNLTNTEAEKLINKALTVLRRSTAQTTKGLQDNLEVQKKMAEGIEGLTDEQTKSFERSAILEQVGIGKQQARQLAGLKGQLELNEERLSKVKEVLEDTGQNIADNPEVQRLELEKRNLEEMMKFGKTLTGFERGFTKFADATFGDFVNKQFAKIEEGGSLTLEGQLQSLGSSISSDFDKVLGFFGPVVGVIQQIPFLGTILGTIGRAVGSLLLNTIAFGKKQIQQKFQEMKQTKFFQKTSLRNDEQMKRQQMKSGMVSGSLANDGQPEPAESGEEGGSGPNRFISASIFLTTASTIGGAAGAGMIAAAKGMTLFGKASFALGKALVVGGAALAIGLTAVFGSFALGEKMGAFDGMQKFGKVNMLKVLGSMLGLATLMGVLGGIVSTGIGALIMGAGALAIMGLIGTLVVVGKGLGNFAESIMPFEQLNIPGLQRNVRGVAGLSEEFKKLAEIGVSGKFDFNQLVGNENQLDILARFINNMSGDMDMALENIQGTKEAMDGFELPSVKFTDLIGGFFGIDGVSKLEQLMSIDFSEGIGDQMSLAGKGLKEITSAMDNLDSDQVGFFEDITDSVKNLENVSFNFNSGGPIPVNVAPTNTDSSSGNNVVAVQASPVANVTNVRRTQFAATGGGSNGKHSALHYPSLG
tara:strand:- start:1114 stop:3060 length:1947 start_codon:yes stop_codon:yes gene_type:complete